MLMSDYLLSPIEDIAQFEGRKYALILAPELEDRHSHNITNAIETFSALGFEEIKVVASQHSGVRIDKMNNTKVTPSVETSLRHVDRALDSLAELIGPTDLFTLYVTGHGSLDNSRNHKAYLQIGGQKLYAGDLADQVNELCPGHARLIISDQCYGADFMYEFTTAAPMVGIAASKTRDCSYSETFPDNFFPALKKTGNVTYAFAQAYLDKEMRHFNQQFPVITIVGEKRGTYPKKHFSGERWAKKIIRRFRFEVQAHGSL